MFRVKPVGDVFEGSIRISSNAEIEFCGGELVAKFFELFEVFDCCIRSFLEAKIALFLREQGEGGFDGQRGALLDTEIELFWVEFTGVFL